MRASICLLMALILAAARPAAAVERETSYVYPPFKHTMGMHRVGQMELKLFLGPRARIANPQGLAAAKLAIRDDPASDRDDDELTLVGVNSDIGQIVYNPSLYAVKSLGKVGAGVGEFNRPRGIDINREGDVVVADTGNRRLVLLKLDDKELTWSRTIADAGGPFSPTDAKFGQDGIWCTDYASGRILRFDREGRFIGPWPAAGGLGLEGPLAMALQEAKDEWNQARRFSLLVVDRQGQRVCIFDADGTLRAERKLDSLITPPGRFGYPALDLHGQVVLPDSVFGRIVKLDPRLDLLAIIDHIDDDQEPLDHPNSLALYRRFGQLFIAENKGGTYAWTGTDVKQARVIPQVQASKPGLMLEYRLTEPSLVSVVLAQAGQELVVQEQRRRQAGNVADFIELKPDLPPDAALLIRATPTYSARKKLVVERRLPIPPGALEALRQGGGGRQGKSP